MSTPRLGVLMGSISDYDVMVNGVRVLRQLEIPYEVKVLSAHRSPAAVATYAGDHSVKVLCV